MELRHEFTVPVGVDEAWRLLLDVERIAPCLPGATLDSVADGQFNGRVKVKIGPIMLGYEGTAWIASADEDQHRAVVEATGAETRGSGTAQLTVTAQLTGEQPSLTRVVTTTDLAITGRPAQFGRGVMVDVGSKLIGEFADCLATRLSGADEAGPPAPAEPAAAAAAPDAAGSARPAGGAAATPEPAAGGPRSAQDRPTPDHIDLVAAARGPVLARVGPAFLGLALVLGLLWWLLGRRRRG
jgi:carbon monoxide dehydrogenase subunit G